jgi:hypothetical protein
MHHSSFLVAEVAQAGTHCLYSAGVCGGRDQAQEADSIIFPGSGWASPTNGTSASAAVIPLEKVRRSTTESPRLRVAAVIAES